VWRPLRSASEIAPIRAAAPGRSALISVDFPMPDWPMMTLCCPSSNGRNAAISRVAAICTLAYPSAA